MHNDKYYRSRIPVSLVLLFLLNLVVVMALEVLLIYRLPAELTNEALAAYDSAYEGCDIIQFHERNKLNCYLVKTAGGEVHLIPTRSHGIVFSRARVYEKSITAIPGDETVTVPLRIGIHTATITVSPDTLPYMENQKHSDLYMSVDYYGGSTQATASLYLVIAALLEAIELAVFHLIRHGTLE